MTENIQQGNNILVAQFLKKFDFSQRCSIDSISSFFTISYFDLFYCNNFIIFDISSLVNKSKLKIEEIIHELNTFIDYFKLFTCPSPRNDIFSYF